MKTRSRNDRRSGLDRRMDGAYAYTAPERRQLKYRRLGLDRRGLLPNLCIYCGKVSDADNIWSQHAADIETSVEYRNGICMNCSYEKFPQLYADE